MDVQKAAVIGHPIGHTMSPFIHKRLFALSGIPLEYQVLDVPDLAKPCRGLGASTALTSPSPTKAPSCLFWTRWIRRPKLLAL